MGIRIRSDGDNEEQAASGLGVENTARKHLHSEVRALLAACTCDGGGGPNEDCVRLWACCWGVRHSNEEKKMIELGDAASFLLALVELDCRGRGQDAKLTRNDD